MFTNSNDVGISTGTLLKITALIVVLFFLWQIRDVLILLLISITFASALEPMAEFLQKKKIPRAVSVLSVYILVLAFIGLIIYLIVPPIVTEFNQIKNTSQLTEQLNNKFGSESWASTFNISEIVNKNVQSFTNQFTNLSNDLFKRTLGVFNGFIQIVTILVISFYLLAEKNGMKNFVYTLMPKRYEAQALHLINRVQKKIGLWLLGQLIISAIMFVAVYVVLSLLGIQYALVLALIAGFLELIPYLGPIMAAIPAVFFAFLQSPTMAIIVLILFIFLQKTEAYVLVPKIMQKTIGVSPLAILVAILVGFKLAGIFGILLSVPIVATINVVIKEWDTLKTLAHTES
jgi:predicted PurR-regulated permease PerM